MSHSSGQLNGDRVGSSLIYTSISMCVSLNRIKKSRKGWLLRNSVCTVSIQHHNVSLCYTSFNLHTCHIPTPMYMCNLTLESLRCHSVSLMLYTSRSTDLPYTYIHVYVQSDIGLMFHLSNLRVCRNSR